MTEPVAPRLAPLTREQWNDDVPAALRGAFSNETVERFLSNGPDAIRLPNAITTMMHHPAVAGPWLAFNNVLLWKPALTDRWRELMVLRVAWRTRSNYEWVQHVQLAPRFGITPDEVDAVARNDTSALAPVEVALVAAADQLLDTFRVDDDTWATLAEHLDERQLVELVFVVGAYTCLAMAFRTFGVQLEAGIDTAAITLPESAE